VTSKRIVSESFEGEVLIGKQYQEYVFEDCDFVDTTIRNSNFSLVQFIRCRLINLSFVDSKVQGVNFMANNPTIPPSLSFVSTDLSRSSLAHCSLRKSKLTECKAIETDFFCADLRNCDCRGTDFSGAILSEASLVGADFRHSINYSINPFQNPQKLRKARFSSNEVINLLSELDIDIE